MHTHGKKFIERMDWFGMEWSERKLSDEKKKENINKFYTAKCSSIVYNESHLTQQPPVNI